MLVAIGCVVFTLLDRVRSVARHRKVPEVFRELVEPRGQGPNEDGDEELCGSATHAGEASRESQRPRWRKSESGCSTHAGSIRPVALALYDATS